jgi:hypothetical protein
MCSPVARDCLDPEAGGVRPARPGASATGGPLGDDGGLAGRLVWAMMRCRARLRMRVARRGREASARSKGEPGGLG